MEPPDDVVDSPTDWVARHIRSYVGTDGRKGHRQWGVPNLLLTTRGRKSGQLRRTALIYGRDGDRYLLVASNGGKAANPGWYYNLLDHPEVWVQVAAEKFAARARPASVEEKPRLWRIMAEMWPQYDGYQAKARRDIPLVILEPLLGGSGLRAAIGRSRTSTGSEPVRRGWQDSSGNFLPS